MHHLLKNKVLHTLSLKKSKMTKGGLFAYVTCGRVATGRSKSVLQVHLAAFCHLTRKQEVSFEGRICRKGLVFGPELAVHGQSNAKHA